MSRETSVETFNQIVNSGLLSTRRLQVYDILFRAGPLTANEMVKIAKKQHPDVNQTGFNARLSELKKMGAIVEIGKKPDSVSGQNCYVWGLTGDMPTPLPRPVSYKTKFEQAMEFIESKGLTAEFLGDEQ